MSATAGVFNHQMTTLAEALKAKTATPADTSTTATGGSSSSDGSGDSATISANDFLTLLVTEMQNQDPTADTDPNEYIDQLVQVNSLEQLIDINQTLSTDLGGTAATPGSGSAGSQTLNAIANQAQTPAALSADSRSTMAHKPIATPVSQIGLSTKSVSGQRAMSALRTQGHLSVSDVNRAAQRVGHALGGRPRARHAASGSSVN